MTEEMREVGKQQPSTTEIGEAGDRGGWTTVGNSRGRRRASVKWEDLVSMFVSNLPELIVSDQLRLAFSSVGRVFDAFIPASSRKGRGFCFGFVRFGNLGSPLKAVGMMNGRSFVGRILEVNIARFGWSQRDRRDGAWKKDRKKVIGAPLNSNFFPMPKGKKVSVVLNAPNEDKVQQHFSFLDVVKGTQL